MQVTKCDRCGVEIPSIVCYDSVQRILPKYELKNQDLCPNCSEEFNRRVSAFMKEQVDKMD